MLISHRSNINEGAASLFANVLAQKICISCVRQVTGLIMTQMSVVLKVGYVSYDTSDLVKQLGLIHRWIKVTVWG